LKKIKIKKIINKKKKKKKKKRGNGQPPPTFPFLFIIIIFFFFLNKIIKIFSVKTKDKRFYLKEALDVH
jgi:hypothetical protein